MRTTFQRFEDQVEILDTATNVEDAKKKVQQLRPDLVLQDLQLPQEAGVWSSASYQHGMKLIEEIRKIAEDTRIIVLSDFGGKGDEDKYKVQPDILYKAIRAGANGYIAKLDNYDGASLTSAIKGIMRGEAIYGPLAAEVSREILDFYDRNRDDILGRDQLTARERQIAELLAKGKSNQEISNQLHLTVGGVKSHVSRIFRKLEISSRHDPALPREVAFGSE